MLFDDEQNDTPFVLICISPSRNNILKGEVMEMGSR